MKIDKKNNCCKNGGLDRFRLAASFLVIAIHTSPLTTISSHAYIGKSSRTVFLYGNRSVYSFRYI